MDLKKTKKETKPLFLFRFPLTFRPLKTTAYFEILFTFLFAFIAYTFLKAELAFSFPLALVLFLFLLSLYRILSEFTRKLVIEKERLIFYGVGYKSIKFSQVKCFTKTRTSSLWSGGGYWRYTIKYTRNQQDKQLIFSSKEFSNSQQLDNTLSFLFQNVLKPHSISTSE